MDDGDHVPVDHRCLKATEAPCIEHLAGEQTCHDGFVLPQLGEHEVQFRRSIFSRFQRSEGTVAEFPRRKGVPDSLLPPLTGKGEVEGLLTQIRRIVLIQCPRSGKQDFVIVHGLIPLPDGEGSLRCNLQP